MFGKHYSSMYEGSMYGAGALVFAVWGYVISHMKPDWKGGMYVELNPKPLADCLGEKEEDVSEVIRRFCGPDPRSRSQIEEGRKLVQDGVYLYRVVNGLHYRQLRDEEDRREYQRIWTANRRRKKREFRQGVKSVGVDGYEQEVAAGADCPGTDSIQVRGDDGKLKWVSAGNVEGPKGPMGRVG